MPDKCCIPQCTSNYESSKDSYVTVFRFPANPEIHAKWIRNIPRKDWHPSKRSVVCINHFRSDDVIKSDVYKDSVGNKTIFPRARPKLKDTAVPCLFPKLPQYLTADEGRHKAEQELQWENEQMTADMINGFSELCEMFTNKTRNANKWLKVICSDFVCFYQMCFQGIPKVVRSVKVDDTLSVQICIGANIISSSDLKWILPSSLKLTRWSQLENILLRYQMESKNKTVIHSDKGDKTKMKKHINQDETSSESQKHHLQQNEICLMEDDEISDYKIGIKQETCDINLASNDIKYDSTVDSGSDEIDIKGEHLNPDEVPTESHRLQNVTYFVECNEVGIKQETWATDISSDFKYDPIEAPTCIDGGSVKGGNEIHSRGASSECVETLVDSHIEEKSGHEVQVRIAERFPGVKVSGHTVSASPLIIWEVNTKKKEISKEILPLESPRFPMESIYSDNTVTLFVEEEDSFNKAACARNTAQGTSMGQNITPFSCNPTCKGGLEQNVSDEHLSVCKCGICDKPNLKGHTHFHQTTESLKCDTVVNLVHSGAKPIQCDICEKSFTKKSLLQRHKLLHSGIKPYKCGVCGKCFTQKSTLQIHTLIHSGTKPYKCDICGKSFTRKSILQSHILLHLGTKPYKCALCEKSFTQKSHLLSHRVVHLGIKPHKCEICQKSFTQKSHLQTHALVHIGIKSYKCDMCEKCFSYRSALKSHKLCHSGTNPHKCGTCGRGFTQKSHLQTHKFVHSGIKPHKCEICDRCFTDRSNLKKHIFAHSGTKPFKCDTCEKCFTQKSYLQSHRLVHSDLTAFKCDICTKCFTAKSILKRHALIHSRRKSYKYENCFVDSESYKVI